MEHRPEISPLPSLAIRLRAATLALGECARPAWWKTQFMNEAGLRFLERLYPRTSFHAAVHAAGRAACDVHDRAVGRIGVYHLFRLPESLEAEMTRVPRDFDEEFISRFRAGLGSSEKLMELLASFSEGPLEKDATPGARRIGVDKDLMSTAGLKRLAAAYHHAFAQGRPAFPYFTAGDRGGL